MNSSHTSVPAPVDCALCHAHPQQEISHIIPNFICKKLREESDSGRFRDAQNPNAVMQDGIKCPMLCSACEDRFSVWERYFANHIFHPSYQQPLPDNTGRGDRTALLFLASLSFRGIAYALAHQQIPAELMREHEHALIILSEFLLDKRPDPSPLYYELYYVTDAAEPSRRITDRVLFYYLKTGGDQDCLSISDGRLQYITHFGPFFCVLTMRDPEGHSPAEGTMYKQGFPTYSLPLDSLPSTLHTYIRTGLQIVRAAHARVSPRQQTILAERWNKVMGNKLIS